MMHRLVGPSLAVALVIRTHGAQADDPGLEVALRSGYAIPFGNITPADGDELSQGVTGAIPVLLELGYREGNVMLGIYGQYAFGFIGDAFDEVCGLDEVDCSIRGIRAGAQLHYHFSPRSSTDSWLGVGLGYERLALHASGPGGNISIALSGFEFLNLQTGIDIRPTREVGVALGPFLSTSLGIYGDASCSRSDVPCPELGETAVHGWFTLGIRGIFTTANRKEPLAGGRLE